MSWPWTLFHFFKFWFGPGRVILSANQNRVFWRRNEYISTWSRFFSTFRGHLWSTTKPTVPYRPWIPFWDIFKRDLCQKTRKKCRFWVIFERKILQRWVVNEWGLCNLKTGRWNAHAFFNFSTNQKHLLVHVLIDFFHYSKMLHRQWQDKKQLASWEKCNKNIQLN